MMSWSDFFNNYFVLQIFTLVEIFGLFHGLVFLPVMLSLLPDCKRQSEVDQEEGKAPKTKKNIQQTLENCVINESFVTNETK